MERIGVLRESSGGKKFEKVDPGLKDHLLKVYENLEKCPPLKTLKLPLAVGHNKNRYSAIEKGLRNGLVVSLGYKYAKCNRYEWPQRNVEMF